MEAPKKILVGLGNPGPEFQTTYHNVGALCLRSIMGEIPEKKHRDLFSYAIRDGSAFVFPLTFMNASGGAVREALKKFSGGTENLFIFHDESDLPVGAYRIAAGRGAAGHKGVQSIMDSLDTKDFTRVRIGIRPPREKSREKAGRFVLKTITKKDRAAFAAVFQDIARELFISAEPEQQE